MLVALQLWGPQWRGGPLVFSDNFATVGAMCLGRAEDPLIKGAIREAWLIGIVSSVFVHSVHC